MYFEIRCSVRTDSRDSVRNTCKRDEGPAFLASADSPVRCPRPKPQPPATRGTSVPIHSASIPGAPSTRPRDADGTAVGAQPSKNENHLELRDLGVLDPRPRNSGDPRSGQLPPKMFIASTAWQVSWQQSWQQRGQQGNGWSRYRVKKEYFPLHAM